MSTITRCLKDVTLTKCTNLSQDAKQQGEVFICSYIALLFSKVKVLESTTNTEK